MAHAAEFATEFAFSILQYKTNVEKTWYDPNDCVPKILQWKDRDRRKICVGIDSLDGLLDLADKAVNLGVLTRLMEDAGYTEFKEPTITCLALGPDYDEVFNSLTSHLELL